MTDIQAAMGREQIKRLPGIITRRREQVYRYQQLLSSIGALKLPREPEWARSNWQSYCVGLPPGYEQRKIMQSMLESGIATRRGIMCAHREEAYTREPWSCGNRACDCGCPTSTCARLRESESAQDTTIILPLFHEMTLAEQDSVVFALQKALDA